MFSFKIPQIYFVKIEPNPSKISGGKMRFNKVKFQPILDGTNVGRQGLPEISGTPQGVRHDPKLPLAKGQHRARREAAQGQGPGFKTWSVSK